MRFQALCTQSVEEVGRSSMKRACVDLWELSNGTEHLSDKPIRTAQRRINLRPNANKATRDSKLQVVVFRKQRDDPREDGLAPILACCVLRDDTRSDLDLHTEFEHARKNRATSDAALELVDLRSGLVHVERADDDQSWIGREVAYRDRDAFDDILVDGVDVELELCRNGDYG